MKICVYLWSHLAQFFSELEMFQTKDVEKIKTHSMFHNLFFRHSCRLWNNVESYGNATRATRDALKLRLACRVTKARVQTLVMFNTFVFSTATMIKRKRLTFALYVRYLPSQFSSVPPDSRCFPHTFLFVMHCSKHWTLYSSSYWPCH